MCAVWDTLVEPPPAAPVPCRVAAWAAWTPVAITSNERSSRPANRASRFCTVVFMFSPLGAGAAVAANPLALVGRRIVPPPPAPEYPSNLPLRVTDKHVPRRVNMPLAAGPGRGSTAASAPRGRRRRPRGAESPGASLAAKTWLNRVKPITRQIDARVTARRPVVRGFSARPGGASPAHCVITRLAGAAHRRDPVGGTSHRVPASPTSCHA